MWTWLISKNYKHLCNSGTYVYTYITYINVSEGMYDNTQDKSHSTYVLYLKIFTLWMGALLK